MFSQLPSLLKVHDMSFMYSSFTRCIPNNWCEAYAQSALTNFYFLDEDVKAESSSEDKGPDELQPQTQTQQQSSRSEASSGGSLVKPEQPDVADRSSQSSFTSQDGTGEQQLWNDFKWSVSTLFKHSHNGLSECIIEHKGAVFLSVSCP